MKWMMDFFTHLFLPIAVVYALRPELFENPLAFALAGFAILPDADKIVAVPGGLHSVLTLLPIALVVIAVERGVSGRLRYAPVAIALLYSHLLLDVIDGNFVMLFAPLVETGIQLGYPGDVVLGGRWPIVIQGDLVSVSVRTPEAGGGGGGPGTYAFLEKYGVLSALVFVLIVSPRFTREG